MYNTVIAYKDLRFGKKNYHGRRKSFLQTLKRGGPYITAFYTGVKTQR